MTALAVWLNDRRAGTLERERGAMRFAYDADYDGPPLSHSLPLDSGPHEEPAAETFFANLLPEGAVRDLVARRVGVSASNDFGLLEAIGGDCAGAVSLLPLDEQPPPPASESEPLSERELAATLAELPRRPLLAADDEDIRLSLAGAQDKLPVVARGSTVAIPRGTTPSTHIIKVPVDALDGTVANEAFCLELARRAGLDSARAEVREAEGSSFLLVERYDRTHGDGPTIRVHQEDFCQALAVAPGSKYENEGGPGFAAGFELLRTVSTMPARQLIGFLEAAVFNFLIGNHDAHAKNFSLLHGEQGTTLAPLYDLLSTAAYPGLSKKTAMRLGGEYRPRYVRRRHIERFASDAGLAVAATRGVFRTLARELPGQAEALRDEASRAGWHEPVLDRALEVIGKRAAQLLGELENPA